ncbi:VOC family protein [Sphingobacterium spiritivorum]|uniref:VOC family protein n=1 Tax=Sphingobacterium spiritivorum TaxID=258 RepID=UPI001918E6AB|nr:VOC family protein [Sphingobacterium spiritivorum]QQT26476.1 glyoxalase [Sphingobacterium spiritivorum]
MKITGGKNIAIKVPVSKYQETVDFYTLTLGLQASEILTPDHPTVKKSTKVVFGDNTLWLDATEQVSRTEAWFELLTDHLAETEAHLQRANIAFEDDLEQIPAHMHWIKDPIGNVFILKESH